MKQKRCVIVSGGDFSEAGPFMPDDFVIACDRGYTYCERLGLHPDLLISDFDSYNGPVAEDIPTNRFRPEKDDTDTMLAMRWAVTHGFREVMLCCALGGRMDHLIANIQSLVFARKNGLRAVLCDHDTEIIAIEKECIQLSRKDGWALSVFAADGPCRGVCIRGAKYPLENAEILPSFPIGVSNQWSADSAEISVEEGILLIVLSRYPEERPADG